MPCKYKGKGNDVPPLRIRTDGNFMRYKISDDILLFCEDNMVTMGRMRDGMVDVILTSPFYSTNKKAGNSRTLLNTRVKINQYDYVRYDVFVDNMTDGEYMDYTAKLFMEFDRILSKNGCILYNMSYGAENPDLMVKAVNRIITATPFTMADIIAWKKSTAMPNSCSSNRLTRVVEYIFVLCRKDELKTFKSNKKITSYRKTGQPAYENINNFVEARNNDGPCPFNKATYSTDLCRRLLEIYAPAGCTVYDPFSGSGTTLLQCAKMGLRCIGSEISENQCGFAKDRILKEMCWGDSGDGSPDDGDVFGAHGGENTIVGYNIGGVIRAVNERASAV